MQTYPPTAATLALLSPGTKPGPRAADDERCLNSLEEASGLSGKIADIITCSAFGVGEKEEEEREGGRGQS